MAAMSASSYISRLEDFLKKHCPNCFLVPIVGSKTEGSKPVKSPLYAHKSLSGDDLWNKWNSYKLAHPILPGLLLLMRGDLIALDSDDMQLCERLEARFPCLTVTSMQQTSKGRHYIFMRTPECDDMRIFDKSRCVSEYDAANRRTVQLELDVKTVCSTGTGGVLSVFPSLNKRWIRAPYDHHPLPFPTELCEFIVKGSRIRQVSSDKSCEVQQRSVPSLGIFPSNMAQPLPQNMQLDSNSDEVINYLNLLDTHRWDDRTMWRNIAIALKYEYGEHYRAAWQLRSRSSLEYDQLNCRRDVSGAILEAWYQGDRGLADVAYELLNDVIKNVDGGSRNFYYFDDQSASWKSCAENKIWSIISKKVEEVLVDIFVHYSVTITSMKAAHPQLSSPDDVSSAGRSSSRKTASPASQEPSSFVEREFNKIVSLREKTLSTISYIQSQTGMRRVTAIAAPFFEDLNFEQKLDGYPFLLGVKNGVVDLRTGHLRERRFDDYIYKVLEVDYDPKADDSLMESTVTTLMADDVEMCKYLQKLLGYAITGDVSEEIFPVFTASGRNGKGLLMQTLMSVIGPFYVEMNSGMIVDRQISNIDAERGKLLGARVVVFNELKDGDKLKSK